MKEQERVIQDVNGEWLCQTRFIRDDGSITKWSTVNIGPTKEQAEAYFKNAPDWVQNF